MAAIRLSPAISSQCCSSKSGAFLPNQGLMAKPARSVTAGRERGMKLTCQAASIVSDGFPSMERRKLVNLLLLGAVGLPAASMLVPFTDFSAGPRSGTSGCGTAAKDEFGNDIIISEWLKTHEPGDRTLTQGLKGDPTYLMVENNTTLATYGINAVSTHLGCIVPWNTVEKKFMCPCHGSHYNYEGTVIRGPAPRSLELARVDIDNGKVVCAPWTETDFRTGHAPWWS